VTLTVRELNALPRDRATELFRSCCGAERWVATMVERRPFVSTDAVLGQADDAWRSLDADDWREAFAHHPRIGERTSAVPQGVRAAAWSSREQAGIDGAAAGLHDALAAINQEYEQRFGYIYIVCASGKSAEELLSLARERLTNTPATELRVAAEEQRRITRLRLQQLFAEQTAEHT
jgi:OHCU decarboxylase